MATTKQPWGKKSIIPFQWSFCFSDTTGQSQASIDKRWSRLLELKKANL